MDLIFWALLSDSSLLCLQVVEPVPEPDHIVVEDSSQEVEVYLSAAVAYTQLKMNTIVVQFKDTLPFQTRTATFKMHNTGKVALEYFWEEPADSKPVKKPYSVTLMRRFLSNKTVKHRRKLLRRYWRRLARPPKVRRRRPDKSKQYSKQQQQQHQEDSKQQQQQQQDSKQQQPSEQPQLSEKEQLDSKQKKGSKKQSRSKERHLSEQQPEQQQPEQQQPEQQEPEQQQPEQQQPEQPVPSKKPRRPKKKLLSQQHLSASLEIFPDFTDELALFSIDPYRGVLAPGQKQTFHVKFSPKTVGKFKTIMRIPNRKPTQRRVRLILKGRARQRKSFGKPKRSVLRQTEDGPRPKKQVHWKLPPE
ncbi:adenylate cyclase, terminal-differentiation specific-like [Haemorhous mexicanus]|uniref:adenylate cyclase, terminal-differentiation specific-like n=1 Tax=Haemorhous mexicanus TaxID=30427 RepID=UPI0028BD2A1B|nr:adenylate cyclase, terminal-differentiation specific-like [Haemorhous mexicanus]